MNHSGKHSGLQYGKSYNRKKFMVEAPGGVGLDFYTNVEKAKIYASTFLIKLSFMRFSRRQADSSKGMLRSKIECGMGTVPINPKLTIQTWDGVLSGDRLLTMACSDKIMRWNIIGMQVMKTSLQFLVETLVHGGFVPKTRLYFQ